MPTMNGLCPLASFWAEHLTYSINIPKDSMGWPHLTDKETEAVSGKQSAN